MIIIRKANSEADYYAMWGSWDDGCGCDDRCGCDN